VLLEVARKKGSYVPELSFGTHFFQDLVEAEIRYIPLYPDEPDAIFNELFFERSRNLLGELLPEFAHLSDVVRVIDVPSETDGEVLQVLMNAELGEAVGILGKPSTGGEASSIEDETLAIRTKDHWRWRLGMAEEIAANLDPKRFGVKGMYVFGSTKNATAGPGSDIDLIVHIVADDVRRQELDIWFEGWSLSLERINYLRTGYRSGGLLDIHYVTDDDIANHSSFAIKIGAVTDAARPLRMKGEED
jgi:pyruvate,water dikinase